MSFIQFSKNKLKQKRKTIRKLSVWFFVCVFLLVLVSFVFQQNVLDEGIHLPKHQESLNYSFDGNLYFNDRDGFEKYSQLTIDAIHSAQESIYMAMYSISDSRVIKLLDTKKKQGIDVQIIIPKSKEIQHSFAFALTDLDPIEVGAVSTSSEIADGDMKGELMHHKFIIIDPETDNRQLLFGSSNLTYLQQKYDSSFLLSTSDASLVSSFFNEFNLLKKKTSGLKKIRSGNFQPFHSKYIYENGFIETWFGPGYMKNSIKQRILDAIENTQETIDIIGWRINDRDIYNALNRKARQGVEIKIIVDDFYMWDELSVTRNLESRHENVQIVSDSYMDVLFQEGKIEKDEGTREDFNPFLHHHALIIDDNILITGTNNWTQGGFYYNDESIIVTNIANLVEDYRKEFSYLSRLLKAKNLDINISEEHTLTIHSEIALNSKIIFYIEKSNPDWLGKICSSMNYQDFLKNPVVPEKCLTKTTRIFISDSNYNLIGSSYLFD